MKPTPPFPPAPMPIVLFELDAALVSQENALQVAL
jgi:hypothetical protein